MGNACKRRGETKIVKKKKKILQFTDDKGNGIHIRILFYIIFTIEYNDDELNTYVILLKKINILYKFNTIIVIRRKRTHG